VDQRVVARLGLLAGVSAAAVGLAVHLAHEAPVEAAAATNAVVVTGVAGSTSNGLTSTPATSLATSVKTGPASAAVARPAPGTAPTGARPPRVVRPVRAVGAVRPEAPAFDPRTGGAVSLQGARGVLQGAAGLAPMHADPMPEGTRLSDPTDTASLSAKADVDQVAEADDEPFAAGAASPVGTPGIRTLGKHVTPSCSGTGSDGNRVQVLYVHEKGTTDRYASVLPILRNEVANVDDVFALSAGQTGGVRRVRWVHDAHCFPVVADVTVPKGALGSDFWGTVSALKALGFTDPHRKYLMFADANEFCGIGTVMDDTRATGNANDGMYASYARVDANCWSSGHSVPAHELTHTLGGVLSSAPHATKNGHCYDESDLMCYDDGSGVAMRKVCADAQEQLLDCHHDDYFSTDPPPGSFLARYWNTARSSFLDAVASAPPPDVTVAPTRAAAETGDAVGLVATSSKTVGWTWSASSKGCTVTAGVAGAATLRCASTATGQVTVTARAVDRGTGVSGSGTTKVTMTRAARPTAAVTVPPSATAGQRPFPVSVTATGKAPFGYAWRAGACKVADPGAASTTVTCPASTTTQSLPVSVSVTQSDGQQVTAPRAVFLTGVPAHAWWWTPKVESGALVSALRTPAGGGPAGRPVSLQVRWVGTSTWVSVAQLATGTGGRVAAPMDLSRAGTFRLVSTGDAAVAGATSPTVLVKVPTKVATSRVGRRVVATLSTRTGARVGGAAMQLQRKQGSRWQTVSQGLTDSAGQVAHTVSSRRAAVYRWVFPGEASHTAAVGGPLRVG
jgi:hypothetical protein